MNSWFHRFTLKINSAIYNVNNRFVGKLSGIYGGCGGASEQGLG